MVAERTGAHAVAAQGGLEAAESQVVRHHPVLVGSGHPSLPRPQPV